MIALDTRGHLRLVVVLLLLFILPTFAVDNNVLFDHIECVVNKDFISEYKCEMRPVAPNVFKMNGTVVLKRPFDNIWVHFQAYYRYSHYQKFIDHWEDVCDFFKSINKAPMLKMLFDTFLHNKVHFNFELQCPVKGTAIVYHPNANMSHFTLPLIPAGRYRVDLNITKGKNGIQFVFAQIHFKISDLRVWH